ncbi:VPA1267 family protein [Vibrio alfacsensis]|uniref:VPA1267 family protein n=1 Tax=Vibrio alfacsensis TaxID=1074311 RepID=UPI0040684603
MANGQQIAQENLDKFLAWKATATEQECIDMMRNGKLNRTELSKVLDIGKSAFRQNPALKAALEDFEQALALRPRFASQTQVNDAQPPTRAPTSHDKHASKVVRLERENGALRAQVLELKAQLSRYKELEEVIAEMGNIL